MSSAGIRSCMVTFPNKIRYFLRPKEMSFIIHLLYLEDLRECGCRTAYSKNFNFKSFRLGRDSFYRCAKRLRELGLIETTQDGKFTDYILVKKNYNRFVEIVNATDNVDILLEFSEREFILKKRSIDMITDIEIKDLRAKGEPLYLKE